MLTFHPESHSTRKHKDHEFIYIYVWARIFTYFSVEIPSALHVVLRKSQCPACLVLAYKWMYEMRWQQQLGAFTRNHNNIMLRWWYTTIEATQRRCWGRDLALNRPFTIPLFFCKAVDTHQIYCCLWQIPVHFQQTANSHCLSRFIRWLGKKYCTRLSGPNHIITAPNSSFTESLFLFLPFSHSHHLSRDYSEQASKLGTDWIQGTYRNLKDTQLPLMCSCAPARPKFVRSLVVGK